MRLLSILFFLLALACFSCNEQAATSDPKSAPVPPHQTPEGIAVAATVHGFFEWYETLASDTSMTFDFVDESGEHPRLNRDVLEKYLAEFRKSGFVSEEFITNERKFYDACEKLWQKEQSGDVPSGLDADKMFCAQDWELKEFTTAPVFPTAEGDWSRVTLLFRPGSPNGAPRELELKKENDKWLLTKVVCDMGVVVE